MAKKLGILVLIGLVMAVVFLPDILYFTAKKAFEEENRDKPWAPKAAYNAGKMYHRFFRFKSAMGIYKKCIATWPEADYVPECYYRVAFCYEKLDRGDKAIAAYRDFIARYPEHEMVGQAKNRITLVQANQ